MSLIYCLKIANKKSVQFLHEKGKVMNKYLIIIQQWLIRQTLACVSTQFKNVHKRIFI